MSSITFNAVQAEPLATAPSLLLLLLLLLLLAADEEALVVVLPGEALLPLEDLVDAGLGGTEGGRGEGVTRGQALAKSTYYLYKSNCKQYDLAPKLALSGVTLAQMAEKKMI